MKRLLKLVCMVVGATVIVIFLALLAAIAAEATAVPPTTPAPATAATQPDTLPPDTPVSTVPCCQVTRPTLPDFSVPTSLDAINGPAVGLHAPDDNMRCVQFAVDGFCLKFVSVLPNTGSTAVEKIAIVAVLLLGFGLLVTFVVRVRGHG